MSLIIRRYRNRKRLHYKDTNIKVGKNTRIDSCEVWENVSIGDYVKIGKDVIISNDVKIQRNVKIEEFSLLQSKTVIYHNAIISPNTTILPNSIIPPYSKTYAWRIPGLGYISLYFDLFTNRIVFNSLTTNVDRLNLNEILPPGSKQYQIYEELKKRYTRKLENENL